jgi:hypothetical protein
MLNNRVTDRQIDRQDEPNILSPLKFTKAPETKKEYFPKHYYDLMFVQEA